MSRPAQITDQLTDFEISSLHHSEPLQVSKPDDRQFDWGLSTGKLTPYLHYNEAWPVQSNSS